jgi:hypothetical protein
MCSKTLATDVSIMRTPHVMTSHSLAINKLEAGLGIGGLKQCMRSCGQVLPNYSM